jgi:hypothetical protein
MLTSPWSRVPDRGTHPMQAAACHGRACSGLWCGGDGDQGTGVRQTVWRDCWRWRGLTPRPCQALLTERGRPPPGCLVRQAPCHARVRGRGKELRTHVKCGSITPTVVWWADVCPRGSGATRAVSGQRGARARPPHARQVPCRARHSLLVSCHPASRGVALD